MENIVDEKIDSGMLIRNYIMACRISTLADVYKELEDIKPAAKYYNECQTMVENMYGGDHPVMLTFNESLLAFWGNFPETAKENH